MPSGLRTRARRCDRLLPCLRPRSSGRAERPPSDVPSLLSSAPQDPAGGRTPAPSFVCAPRSSGRPNAQPRPSHARRTPRPFFRLRPKIQRVGRMPSPHPFFRLRPAPQDPAGRPNAQPPSLLSSAPQGPAGRPSAPSLLLSTPQDPAGRPNAPVGRPVPSFRGQHYVAEARGAPLLLAPRRARASCSRRKPRPFCCLRPRPSGQADCPAVHLAATLQRGAGRTAGTV
jgi:hypothetical protein